MQVKEQRALGLKKLKGPKAKKRLRLAGKRNLEKTLAGS